MNKDADGYLISSTVGFWFLVYTLGATMTYCRRITAEKININLSLQIKNDYFTQLLKKKLSIFGEQQTGSLSQQLNKDIDDITNITTTELSSAFRGFVFFTFSLLYIIYNFLALALFILLPMGALAAVGAYYGKILKRKKGELGELNRQLNSFTQEKFMQIKTVKLFTGESLEIKNFNTQLSQIKEKSIIIGELTSRFYAIMEFLGENTVIVSAGFAVYLLHNSPFLTLGKLTAFATYGVYTGNGFTQMVSGYTEILKGSGLFKEISKVINDHSGNEEILSVPLEPSKHKSGLSISIQAISFTYPGRDVPVLNDVSMSINSGEI